MDDDASKIKECIKLRVLNKCALSEVKCIVPIDRETVYVENKK